MPNWCSNTITIDGDNLDGVAAELNRHLGPIYSAENAERKSIFRNCECRLDFKPWGVEEEWIILNGPASAFNGRIELSGDSAWMPPVEGLVALSRRLPQIVVNIRYSTDGKAGSIHIENGKWSVTTDIRGYFHWPSFGHPIHHYVVRCAGQEIEDAIRASGIAIQGEGHLWKAPALTVRHASALYALADARGWKRDKEYHLLDYTLDEDAYIGSIETMTDGCDTELRATEEMLSKLRAVAQRGQITLTPNEVDLIKRGWPLQVYDPWFSGFDADAKECRKCVDELPRWAEIPFHPTAREITLLLAVMQFDPARRKELQNALANPAWTREWPLWDFRAAGKTKAAEERKSAPVEPPMTDIQRA